MTKKSTETKTKRLRQGLKATSAKKTITSQNVSSVAQVKNFFNFVKKLCPVFKILKFLHF